MEKWIQHLKRVKKRISDRSLDCLIAGLWYLKLLCIMPRDNQLEGNEVDTGVVYENRKHFGYKLLLVIKKTFL